MRRGLWLGAAGLLLVGCTDFQPVHWGGKVPWEQARKAIYEPSGERSRMVPENGRHVVMPGETVSELAVLYRVPAADIIARNDLERPYHIYVGQVLRLPRPGSPPPSNGRSYAVARGDTLSGIAEAHRVRLGDLIALNPELDPRRLHVGTRVRRPASAAGNGTAVARAAPPPQQVATTARPRPNQRPAQAAPATTPPAPGKDKAIKVVNLPPPAAAPRPENVEATPSAAERDAARQRNLAAVAAPPLSGEGFHWPVDAGELINTFGAKPDGRRNDGINIAAPEGSIVRAAENGLVVYADEDLAAFGRMLLIRHAEGYLTAYAHNEALLVTRGDLVKRGQPVAKVGRTGEVVEPQLHFEIRRGKGALDPVALLGDGEIRLAERQ